MTIRIHVTVASIVTAVAAFAAIVPACAGGDKVAFPEDHAAGVLFTTVDRPDNKQFRELYTSAEALDADCLPLLLSLIDQRLSFSVQVLRLSIIGSALLRRSISALVAGNDFSICLSCASLRPET